MPAKLDARAAHARMRAALTALRDAERNAVTLFAEINQRRLYRELGYATIHEYATRGLGFSRTKTYEFLRLAEALESLPRLRKSVEAGKVSWTKAREVVKVATPATEQRWLTIASESSRRELEREVVRSRSKRDCAKVSAAQGELIPASRAARRETPAAAPPQLVSLRLGPMQRARFDALVEKLMKKLHCSREDVLLLALESLAAGKQSPRGDKSSRGESSPGGDTLGRSDSSPRGESGSPYQVVVHRCDACGTGQVGQERNPLDRAEMARVECDAQILEPGKRSRRSIPPARRRAVLLRDGHRCRARGCDHAGFLEVHHLVPLSRGGGNEAANLVTLCSSCHGLIHGPGGRALALRKP